MINKRKTCKIFYLTQRSWKLHVQELCKSITRKLVQRQILPCVFQFLCGGCFPLYSSHQTTNMKISSFRNFCHMCMCVFVCVHNLIMMQYVAKKLSCTCNVINCEMPNVFIIYINHFILV